MAIRRDAVADIRMARFRRLLGAVFLHRIAVRFTILRHVAKHGNGDVAAGADVTVAAKESCPAAVGQVGHFVPAVLEEPVLAGVVGVDLPVEARRAIAAPTFDRQAEVADLFQWQIAGAIDFVANRIGRASEVDGRRCRVAGRGRKLRARRTIVGETDAVDLERQRPIRRVREIDAPKPVDFQVRVMNKSRSGRMTLRHSPSIRESRPSVRTDRPLLTEPLVLQLDVVDEVNRQVGVGHMGQLSNVKDQRAVLGNVVARIRRIPALPVVTTAMPAARAGKANGDAWAFAIHPGTFAVNHFARLIAPKLAGRNVAIPDWQRCGPVFGSAAAPLVG